MSEQNVFLEIWVGFRPYFVRLSIDFLISVFLWLVLYAFELLADRLSIAGWAGEFIRNIHSAGAVGIYALFSVLFLRDLYTLHRHQPHE